MRQATRRKCDVWLRVISQAAGPLLISALLHTRYRYGQRGLLEAHAHGTCTTNLSSELPHPSLRQALPGSPAASPPSFLSISPMCHLPLPGRASELLVLLLLLVLPVQLTSLASMVLVHLGQPRQPDQPSATVPARLGPTVPRSDELHVGTRPSNSRPTWLALQANHPQQPTSKARPCNDTLPSNGALLVPVSPLVPVLTLRSSFPLCIQPGAGLIRTGTHLNLCPPICPSSPASVSRDSPPCSFHHARLGL